MKNLLILTVVYFLTSTLQAQKPTTSYRINFGKAAEGFTQVKPATIYTKEQGYGFDFGSSVTAVDRGGKDVVKGSFVTSDKPFYFSVNEPEGNYKVTVTLGDLKDKTLSTVKAESRRLMLENIKTEPGQLVTRSFIVNVKDRKINDRSQVSLKSRELTKLDWDDKLTLEFDLQTAVHSIEITKVEDQITVFLAGNSTVVDQDDEPWASWGQMIPRFLNLASLLQIMLNLD